MLKHSFSKIILQRFSQKSNIINKYYYKLFHSSSVLNAGFAPPPQHIETPDNKLDTPFDFSVDEYKEINKILAKYPTNYKQSAVIPLLYIAQDHCEGWIPLAAMNKIANLLEIHPMRVYEVATFYTMFNRFKIGKYHLQVCGTTPCMIRGSDDVFRAIHDHLGIHVGETTDDGLFTVSEVECLAACANGAMMQINNEWVYEDLNYDNTIKLLDDLKNNKAKPGSQIGRNRAEGPLGRTTLLNGTPQPCPCRDFDQLKKDLEEQAAKQKQQQQQQAQNKPPPPPPAK